MMNSANQNVPFLYPTNAARLFRTASPPIRNVRERVLRWFCVVVLAGFAFSVIQILLTSVIRDRPVDTSLRTTVHGRIPYLLQETSYDSWLPLLKAYRRQLIDPRSGPYSVFFQGHGKFQYPPPALFLGAILPQKVVEEAIQKWDGSSLQYWNGWLCRIAILATIALAAAIAHSASKTSFNEGSRLSIPLTAAIVAAGLTYYPFIVGYELGQIQLTLNLLVASAFLCFLRGSKLLAGIFIGLCCLVKPQYGVVLIWCLLRNERRMAAGLLLTVVPTLAATLIYFGLTPHFEYLRVLGFLAKHGEVFWFNQSLNGLLNRFVDPGAAYFYDEIGSPLPPYRLSIHIASTVFGIGLITWALFGRSSASSSPHTLVVDLATVVVAATIASPVAWNHHYGAFFPVFAAVLPAAFALNEGRWMRCVLLAVAYLAISLEVVAPEFMFKSAWRGLLSSHIFLGGLLLMVSLKMMKRAIAPPLRLNRIFSNQ